MSCNILTGEIKGRIFQVSAREDTIYKTRSAMAENNVGANN